MKWQSFLQPDQEDNQHLSRTANKTLLSWQEAGTQGVNCTHPTPNK